MSAAILKSLATALGEAGLVTGRDMAAWSRDWTGEFNWTPLCVARPKTTSEVQAVLTACHAARQIVVPISGNTGVSGGTFGEGAVMLSLDRMNAPPAIRPDARVAVAEAGVIVSKLNAACAGYGLQFPLSFGARDSALIGGVLATNAGGANVLRHGNARDLVLGLEAVLADGRVMDLTSALHKNNSGYDLRHLLIGSEGTLGVITRAVLQLSPKPLVTATAMVGLASLKEALVLLNRLQDVSGQAVEAFEYMSPDYLGEHARRHPDEPVVLPGKAPVTVLLELTASAERDVAEDFDGRPALAGYLETVLAGMHEEGALEEAVVALSEAQRAAFWAIRERSAEICLSAPGMIEFDLAFALDDVESAITALDSGVAKVDPGARVMTVGHLGDGNLHFAVWPSATDEPHREAIRLRVEQVVQDFDGTFSAEHGIGRNKLSTMLRRKDSVALDVMRAIKSALDPHQILNPGAMIPDRALDDMVDRDRRNKVQLFDE